VIVPSLLNALASFAVIVIYPSEAVVFVKLQTVSPFSFVASTLNLIPSTCKLVLDSLTAFIFNVYPWHILINVESVPSLESVPFKFCVFVSLNATYVMSCVLFVLISLNITPASMSISVFNVNEKDNVTVSPTFIWSIVQSYPVLSEFSVTFPFVVA